MPRFEWTGVGQDDCEVISRTPGCTHCLMFFSISGRCCPGVLPHRRDPEEFTSRTRCRPSPSPLFSPVLPRFHPFLLSFRLFFVFLSRLSRFSLLFPSGIDLLKGMTPSNEASFTWLFAERFAFVPRMLKSL